MEDRSKSKDSNSQKAFKLAYTISYAVHLHCTFVHTALCTLHQQILGRNYKEKFPLPTFAAWHFTLNPSHKSVTIDDLAELVRRTGDGATLVTCQGDSAGRSLVKLGLCDRLVVEDEVKG